MAIILTLLATPSMPTPLPPLAAMIPATCVPCPWSSIGFPLWNHSSETVLTPYISSMNPF